MRESGKAHERLSLNKIPRKFVPIELPCQHVTNPLKPATNCLCSPYKFMEQLGLGAFSDPAAPRWLRQEPWLESVINFPFFFFCELHCLGSLLSSRLGTRPGSLDQEKRTLTGQRGRINNTGAQDRKVQCKSGTLLRSIKVSRAEESFL